MARNRQKRTGLWAVGRYQFAGNPRCPIYYGVMKQSIADKVKADQKQELPLSHPARWTKVLKENLTRDTAVMWARYMRTKHHEMRPDDYVVLTPIGGKGNETS